MELDDPICYCFHISKRKVLNYIRLTEPRVASQLSECGGAGTGCGWCIPFLRRYFEQARAAQPDDTLAGREISAAEYAQARGEYIRDGGGTPPPGAIPAPQSDRARDDDADSSS